MLAWNTIIHWRGSAPKPPKFIISSPIDAALYIVPPETSCVLLWQLNKTDQSAERVLIYRPAFTHIGPNTNCIGGFGLSKMKNSRIHCILA